MVNSNQGSDGKVLLQLLSQNPNVQMEFSESGTIRLKYGEEVILETNLQIPQLHKSESLESLPPNTTPEIPDSKTNTQTTPESNPQPESTMSRSNTPYQIILPPRSITDKSLKTKELLLFEVLKSIRVTVEDLKDICFVLCKEKYEEIKNEQKKPPIYREIHGYLESRDELDKLVDYFRKERDDIFTWLQKERPDIFFN